MATSTRPLVLGASLLAAGLAGPPVDAAGGGKPGEASGVPATTAEGYRITGPYTHENLAVFLIHGKDRLRTRTLLTLQEAIQQKKVLVHETSNVNQLAVENVSDADVYIHSGDIVKGGRQDRMISQDLIVPPKSGRVPIGSFCVEQGRWSRRGAESVFAFSSSSDQVAGTALKLAARRKEDQGEVWKEVAAAQEKLKQNVGAVASPQSPSSLQLTLEDGKVREGVDRYLLALSPRGAGEKDVVGVGFAINGRLSSVEIYASRGLFEKLWPKLLKAASVEAIAESKGPRPAADLSPAAVKAWLAEADRAQAEERALSPRVKLVTREAGKNLLFETLDREGQDTWVHRSYVAK